MSGGPALATPVSHPLPGHLLAQDRRLLEELEVLTWKPMKRCVLELKMEGP